MAWSKGSLYGVGINDSDYNVTITEFVDGKSKQTWMCPFYKRWSSMLRRCYSSTALKINPTYAGCSVVTEWHYFMTFRSWMEKQDWEGKELDKDLLIVGNKIYGPDTCVFLDKRVNGFLLESTASRGEYPIGVNFHKLTGKFQARGTEIESGERKQLGLFKTAKEAYEVWLDFKLKQAYILASKQDDVRVSKALIQKYINYKGSD